MSADDAASGQAKKVDSTGDPYEDFPDDQEGDLKSQDYVKIASELKDYGNKAFKAGDLNLALDKYQKGLRYLDHEPKSSDEDNTEITQQKTTVRFSLHSNSALIQIKLKVFNDALESAKKAIELTEISDTDKAKAYYRKALANIGRKDDEQALTDLEEALKLAPGDAAITKELGLAKKKAADQVKKEKAAYKKFFD